MLTRKTRGPSASSRIFSTASVIVLFWVCLPIIAAETEWNIVDNIGSSLPPGVSQSTSKVVQKPFPRPLPRTLDPNIISDYGDSFRLLQEIAATGDNLFTDVSPEYVLSIKNAFVEGEGGLVYDAARNVYHLPHFFHNRTSIVVPMPLHSVQDAQSECIRYDKLATVIQRYGHMYYHFLEETLPRVVSLIDFGLLTPDTKILTWGKAYEAQYLLVMGIQPNQIVSFDPERVYCANTLLVPTPVPRITPPREALLAVRRALRIQTLPEEERNTIVYVSRENEPTRAVANEADILRSIKASFPNVPLEVFKGDLSASESISLFQRAKVIVGPHGAGLSHMIFAAPGTTVIEFLFMADPPMMFWHTAAALGQTYWMVPVPNSYYMQHSMTVPVGEVLDILQATLSPASTTGCRPGTAGAGTTCMTCPAGSYAYNTGSVSCKLCFPGRVSTKRGSTYCSTCHAGTYSSAAGRECTPCPAGTFSPIAGGSEPGHCLTPATRRKQLEDHAANTELLSKLSPVFEKALKRRALVQSSAGGVASATNTLTQQELCDAQKEAQRFGNLYQGPYMLNSTDVLCPPPTTTIDVPVVPPPYGMNPGTMLPPGPIPNLPGVPIPPPAPLPEPEPLPYEKKKSLDTWIIALIAISSILILIPCIVCLCKWGVTRRRRAATARANALVQESRASSRDKSSKASGSQGSKKTTKQMVKTVMTSNTLFDVNADSSNA